MRLRGMIRLLASTALLFVVALGVWQCDRDATGPGSGALRFHLTTLGLTPEEVDSIEIEISTGGVLAVRDTVPVAADGSFMATFAVDAGGPYSVQLFARGEGSALLPDSTQRGVLGYGRQGGIDIKPGHLAEISVALAEGRVGLDSLWGSVGSRTLGASWPRVAGATAYNLGWFVVGSQESGREADLNDTTVTLSWDGPVGTALSKAGEDTLRFAVQPMFGERAGVFGPSYPAFLAQWMSLPRLVEIWPASGEQVPYESAAVWMKFDRPMNSATLLGTGDAAGVFWERSASGSAVPFTYRESGPEDGSEFLLEAEAGALDMGTAYIIRITPALLDSEGRPFDAAPDLEGLQSALIPWSTKAYDPLRLIEMEPGPGSIEVDPDVTLRLLMNRRVQYASLSDSAVFLTGPGGGTVPAVLDTAESAQLVTVAPVAPLWFETTYTVHVTEALKDHFGDPFDNNSLTYPELEPLALPFTIGVQPAGPRVIAAVPDSGAVAVEVGQAIRVTFNVPVDSATVIANQSFWLKRNGSFGVNGRIHNVGGAQQVYVFTPVSVLQPDTMYEVEVTSDVLDLQGHPLDQDRDRVGYQSFVARFRTENPPRVVSAEPPADASEVAVDEPLRLTFSTDLDAASVTGETVQLRAIGAVPVPCTRLVEPAHRITLTPQAPLAYLRTYQVWVDTLVTGIDGSRFDQESASGRQRYEAFFTTEPESLHPRVALVYPGDGATGIAIDDSIVVTFMRPVKPNTVTSASFLVTRTTGPGAPEAVGAQAIEVSSDSVQARFRPAGSLDHGQLYQIEVTSGVRNPGGFGLDQDPDSDGLQPFQSSFQTLNESIPPRVIHSDPAHGATGVAVDENIILQFSEPMDSSSVAAAFSVAAGQDTLTGSGGMDPTWRFWTFHPDPEMAYGTLYTVAVDTTATDLVGNRLDQNTVSPERIPFTSTFTTEIETTPPMVLGMAPPSGSDSVDVMLTLRVEFSEPVDSTTVESPGAFTVGPDGGDFASGIFGYESGQAIVTWTPETPLDFSTTYRVTCNSTITDLYGNALDQDPLSPGNQLWRGSFTTWAETIPPRVIALLPEENPVPTTVAPIVLFSEPIDPATLDGAVSIRDPWNVLVSFTSDLSPTADSLRLIPVSPLVHSTTYTVTVDTLVADTLGNRLDQDELIDGRQAFSGQIVTETDLAPPTLLAMHPADGDQHVVPESSVLLIFSEPLDPGTVSPATLYITGPGGQVPCQLVCDAYCETIELIPDSALSGGVTYGVHVSTLVRDLAQRRFDADPETPGDQELNASFRIGRPPVIVWGGGICAVGDSAVVTFDATASYDPDSLLADSIAVVTWYWGDGAVETLPGPDGLWASHDYVVIDNAGCDGIDNDGDGEIDETGFDGCDESYHVILEIEDAYGFSVRDTAGVSFCTFQVLASDPVPGEQQVRPDDAVRLTFSRAVDPDSLDADNVIFTTDGGEQAVAYTASLEVEDTILVLTPENNLSAGEHTVTVTGGVVDQDGQRLDQDPHTPQKDAFVLTFSVNSLPLLVWDRGQCLLGDTALVHFDASGSSDPDAGDAIAAAVWIWGDGERDSLAAPEGLIVEHLYPHQDIAGCDGLDNDGDGEIDETGPDGCDESYRVILRIYDTQGASVADTAGVSFCAFLVFSSDPVAGQVGVGADAEITIVFTRAVDPATVDAASVRLTTGGGNVAVTYDFPLAPEELVITPVNPLNPGGTYELEITSAVTDDSGVALDQDPQTAEQDSFTLTFYIAEGGKAQER